MSDFYRLKGEGKIMSDGVNVKTLSTHGPLSNFSKWIANVQ